MTTKIFLKLLADNPQKELVFEYRKNEFIPTSFHITEVKNSYFNSVDCGGNMHEEYQTIVQLWVNQGEPLKSSGMSAKKALQIFNIVDKLRPMRRDTGIFFEYGFIDLPTSVYSIDHIKVEAEQIIIKMFVPKTVCKPNLLILEDEQQNGGCCQPAIATQKNYSRPGGCC